MTMLLAYEGFDLEKMTIAEEYLVYRKTGIWMKESEENPMNIPRSRLFSAHDRDRKKYLTAQKSSQRLWILQEKVWKNYSISRSGWTSGGCADFMSMEL